MLLLFASAWRWQTWVLIEYSMEIAPLTLLHSPWQRHGGRYNSQTTSFNMPTHQYNNNSMT